MLGIPTCWYLKMLKFALPSMQTPNANRWNIGGIGSPTQNSCIGHVDFMLFVFISFVLVTQREPSLQWNMGLSFLKFYTQCWGDPPPRQGPQLSENPHFDYWFLRLSGPFNHNIIRYHIVDISIPTDCITITFHSRPVFIKMKRLNFDAWELSNHGNVFRMNKPSISTGLGSISLSIHQMSK